MDKFLTDDGMTITSDLARSAAFKLNISYENVKF